MSTEREQSSCEHWNGNFCGKAGPCLAPHCNPSRAQAAAQAPQPAQDGTLQLIADDVRRLQGSILGGIGETAASERLAEIALRIEATAQAEVPREAQLPPERSTPFLDWWHDHGRKLCITPECAEYVFEAGRAALASHPTTPLRQEACEQSSGREAPNV